MECLQTRVTGVSWSHQVPALGEDQDHPDRPGHPLLPQHGLLASRRLQTSSCSALQPSGRGASSKLTEGEEKKVATQLPAEPKWELSQNKDVASVSEGSQLPRTSGSSRSQWGTLRRGKTGTNPEFGYLPPKHGSPSLG